MIYYYIIFYFLIFIPLLALHQETIRPGAIINSIMKKYLYKESNIHDYLAEDHLKQPYDLEVPYCDWKNMSSKQFFREYVRKGRPCLFKDYAKL
jgi:hypothetical protein